MRGDGSRARHSGGSGLGLAIVRAPSCEPGGRVGCAPGAAGGTVHVFHSLPGRVVGVVSARGPEQRLQPGEEGLVPRILPVGQGKPLRPQRGQVVY